MQGYPAKTLHNVLEKALTGILKLLITLIHRLQTHTMLSCSFVPKI